MFDQITVFEGGTIHHGPNNKRVYVMKLPEDNVPRFLDKIEILAGANAYEKIFVKTPQSLADLLLQREYECEARVPGFYRNGEDCCFMSRFLIPVRREVSDAVIIDDVLQTARGCVPAPAPKLPDDMKIRRTVPGDAQAMAEVYKQVFASYPFPIHNPEYLRETMADNIIYHGIWQNDKLVALASAELDRAERNSEMTDFAVLPEQRGQKLGSILLASLEADLHNNEDIKTLYTIARAASHGMNCTFARMGYNYGGRLINNTQIAGKIESMNIWHKEAVL
ncbi:MAG: putative beta-lysine N-acetyltransferase [Eubacteriales bacterium]|nr:putative beta-lysine N-acetyltransferase [Eubacteriales bacterium]MDD3504157.1 putative beta-lysine N-acetyltransferase [Eubacteriales bacterium]